MYLSGRALRRLAACPLIFGLAGACGARTSLQSGEPSEPPKPCASDADCDTANRCAPEACVSGLCHVMSRIDCDDGDPCTTDTCDPATGACHSEPNTPDEDGDGYRAPLPGHSPTDPNACGNDCNDSSAAIHPGATEICNGVDDNCNGAIDEGATYSPSSADAVRISSSAHLRALGGGMAFDGAHYGVLYGGKDQKWNGYFRGLDSAGGVAIDDVDVTHVNADTFMGPIVWTGDQFGVVWTDTRLDNNYEVYFNRLDHDGKKFGKDVRITDAPNFSLHPALAWTGAEFVTAWDDRRPDSGSSPPDNAAIYAQRVDARGAMIGGNVKIVPRELGAEYPAVAVGTARLGVVYTTLTGDSIGLGFSSVSPDLADIGGPVDLGFPDAHAPSLAFVKDRFIAAWDVYGNGPGDAIWGAALDEHGGVLVPPHALTSGAAFARSESLVSLGDRLILLWADDHDGNYELYSKTLALDLSEVTPRARITNNPADSLGPMGVIGPQGEIGVTFDDWRDGTHQLWFARLQCTSVAR